MTTAASDGINWPHPSIKAAWEGGVYASGVTEPWIQQAVASLLIANNSRVVLELGSYLGLTTAWLAAALESLGGGTLISVELNDAYAQAAEEQLSKLQLSSVKWRIHTGDAIEALKSFDCCSFDFAWVDDDHTPQHVAEELDWLLAPTAPAQRRMKPGGLVTMHDVDGPIGVGPVCARFGGLVLRLPHPGRIAGGLGILQAKPS